MDKESIAAINARLDMLTHDNIAMRRLLSSLFATSPEAMAWLQKVDPQWVRDELEAQPVTDALIDRVLLTMQRVRRDAERGLH